MMKHFERELDPIDISANTIGKFAGIISKLNQEVCSLDYYAGSELLKDDMLQRMLENVTDQLQDLTFYILTHVIESAQEKLEPYQWVNIHNLYHEYQSWCL